ncbi:TENS3 protein, partial [Heliornis fulica]|nr:TENS3 protein [Heliornis fulica]
MEESYQLDLTYITERIIAVSFPAGCSEETYAHNLRDVTRMLKSKHGNNYLVLNLSEKRYDLAKLNPKIMDVGWPDLHAPPLDKVCTICKVMESWLNSDPQHVVVIHCRGGKGRIGVVISSYMHFTNVSASADQALDRFAMKKFFDDKVSALMQPSQRRYVQFLSDLLSGSVKMNASPLFLHYVVLHGIPSFGAGGACRPFLKLYQAMQPVFTSGIYSVGQENESRICIAIDPAQLLKGDVMVTWCLARRIWTVPAKIILVPECLGSALLGDILLKYHPLFSDDRFPDYGKVELVFSATPEKIQGCEHLQSDHGVTVDCSTSDPLVRWDSYEHVSPDGEVLHTQGPIDGSLYAKVRKKSSSDSSIPGVAQGVPATGSPDHSDHTLSVSSDSGHSTASIRTDKTEERLVPGARRGLSPEEKAELDQLLSGFGLEDSINTTKDVTDARSKYSGTCRVVPAQVHMSRDIKLKDRETDILDDEMPNHDLHSVDSIGTLSSSEGQHSGHMGNFSCHKSSQNSLLSDGFGSNTGEEHHNAFAPDQGVGVDHLYERSFRSTEPKSTQRLQQNAPVSPKPPVYGPSNYSTGTWVRQQQLVTAHQYSFAPESEIRVAISNSAESLGSAQRQFQALDTPARAFSSRDAVQRALGSVPGAAEAAEHPGAESFKTRPVPQRDTNGLDLGQNTEDLPASPTLDIDQSIEQLNRLILELDPAFEPIPTRINTLSRDRNQRNGFTSPDVHVEGLGRSPGFHDQLEVTNRSLSHCGLRDDGAPGGRLRKLSVGQYDNDGPGQLPYNKCGWMKPPAADQAVNPGSPVPLGETEEMALPCYRDGIDGGIFSPTKNGNESVPSTLASPLSPETSYGKEVHCTSPSLLEQTPPLYHQWILSSQEVRGLSELHRTRPGAPLCVERRPGGKGPRTLTGSSPFGGGCAGSSAVRARGGRAGSGGGEATGLAQANPCLSCIGEPRSEHRAPDVALGVLNREEGSSLPLTCSQHSFLLQPGMLLTRLRREVALLAYGSTGLPGPSLQGCVPLSQLLAWTESRSYTEAINHSLAMSDSTVNTTPALLRANMQTDPSFQHCFTSSCTQHHGGNLHSQPPLPEKKRSSEGDHSFASLSPSSSGFSSPNSGSTISIPFPNVLPDFSKMLSTSPVPEDTTVKHVTVKFVQDTSKFWYKPDISREQAVAVLKDKEPGAFIVRDSHSFRGAYGLAMKVATPPPSVLQLNRKAGDLANELVRHFLIECTHKGVRLKGCPNEPYFGSLTALVYQHSITPLALPCKLLIPDRDPLEEIAESSPQTAANSAAELLKQGAACNVWYLNSVEMESLTGHQAVQKALSLTLTQEPPPLSTVVHFKVSAQGITLTDNQRKLFFRRHYPVNTVIFCALDPQDRKWMRDGLSAKLFGFIARKQGSATDNICHLFAEHDPEQPASAIVNFVSKVMIGSQKKI